MGSVNDGKHQYGTANTINTEDKMKYSRVYLGANGLGIEYGELAK